MTMLSKISYARNTKINRKSTSYAGCTHFALYILNYKFQYINIQAAKMAKMLIPSRNYGTSASNRQTKETWQLADGDI